LLATVTVTVIAAIIGGCLLLATTAAGVIIVRCSWCSTSLSKCLLVSYPQNTFHC
jgi:hypothetical protein